MTSCSLGASLAVSSQPRELVLCSSLLVIELLASRCVDYAKAILRSSSLTSILLGFPSQGQLDGAGARLHV